QAMGLPVISTRHNGIPEGVLDGESGFLVAERDVSALASKMCYLAGHPKLWPDMGEKGRRFVESKYKLSDMLTALEKMAYEA
ncbi:MAG TPA: glycosyltransferase, partial [Candidatus Omnitrophota bacterium]|nr:glycosyltransferase [Candidatus Omnitrophota bacterium]